MSFKVRCDKCGDELTQQGGLLFGPPIANKTAKYHLCNKCYIIVRNLVVNEIDVKPKRKSIFESFFQGG